MYLEAELSSVVRVNTLYFASSTYLTLYFVHMPFLD
jgi:hypothetical protein